MSTDERIDETTVMDQYKKSWVYNGFRQVKKKFYPDGFPSHIDLNIVWLELDRTRNDPSLTRHAMWAQIRATFQTAVRWRLMGHESWRESEAVNGRLPAWCRPEILLAIKILGFFKHGKNVCPQPMNEVWHILRLNFILEEPSNRTVDPYWEGANFDDPAWLADHVHPWKKINKQPPFNINQKFRADFIQIHRPHLVEARRPDQQSIRGALATTLPTLAPSPAINFSTPQIGTGLVKSIEEPIVVDDEELENESNGTQDTGDHNTSSARSSQCGDSAARGTETNDAAKFPTHQVFSGAPMPTFAPISAVVNPSAARKAVKEKEDPGSPKNNFGANLGRIDREVKAMRDKLDQFTQGFQSQLANSLKDQHDRFSATINNALSGFDNRLKHNENAVNETKNSVAHLGKRLEQNENASEQARNAFTKLEKRVRTLEDGSQKSAAEDRYESSTLLCKNMEIDMLKSQLREANANLQRMQTMPLGPFPTGMAFTPQSYPQQPFFTSSINHEREPAMSLGHLFPVMGAPSAAGPSTMWQNLDMPISQMTSSHMSPILAPAERVEVEAEQSEVRDRSRAKREEEAGMN